MNLQRAINIVKRQCGFRQVGDADIMDIFIDAQEQIETTYPVEPLPWFLLTERSDTTTLGEEERVLVPSDFMTEWEEDALWLQFSSGGEKALKKYDADDARAWVNRFSDANQTSMTTSGDYMYALTGDYFRLFPTPPDVLTLKMIYYQKQPAFSSLTDEGRWLKYAPWVLIGMAGENYAHALRDAAAMDYFQKKKGAALQAITDFTINRQLTNRRMAMGETL